MAKYVGLKYVGTVGDFRRLMAIQPDTTTTVEDHYLRIFGMIEQRIYEQLKEAAVVWVSG